ncbi:hypothetical protein DFJ58DRAFT_726894 [Suillus subalutaceus]|uniref:uncharacterized protein n=1 Tax=Suillus subalutaceus TaxID=48586 RepID=UPI001B875C9F|nr:uncharacterized protein DFJ58DRAFT_726894 [Suillus subalutaceus]KAG1857318.1 hypothetical protein DFJ58DRAFT_726894 [Suillus subalutaceus]
MDELGLKDEPMVVVSSRTHLVKTEVVVKRSVLCNILMCDLHTILRWTSYASTFATFNSGALVDAVPLGKKRGRE